MTFELPDWVETLDGFDETGWWLPVGCADEGGHPFELLGIFYEHAGDKAQREQDHPGSEVPLDWRVHDLRWSPGPPVTDGFPGIGFSRMDDDEQAEVRARGIEGPARYGLGSMYIRCGCGRTPRLNRKQWTEMQRTAFLSQKSLPWIDLSDPRFGRH